MTKSDLLAIKGLARNLYLNFPAGVKLDGCDRVLDSYDILACSYIEATITYFRAQGALTETRGQDSLLLKLIRPDSEPETDDYDP